MDTPKITKITEDTVAVIERFGKDDFSIYFPDIDYSVRGKFQVVFSEMVEMFFSGRAGIKFGSIEEE